MFNIKSQLCPSCNDYDIIWDDTHLFCRHCGKGFQKRIIKSKWIEVKTWLK